MTAVLQASHPCARDAKATSAAWDSIHLHHLRVTNRTMEAAHPEAILFSRAGDSRQRGALHGGENGRRP